MVEDDRSFWIDPPVLLIGGVWDSVHCSSWQGPLMMLMSITSPRITIFDARVAKTSSGVGCVLEAYGRTGYTRRI